MNKYLFLFFVFSSLSFAQNLDIEKMLLSDKPTHDLYELKEDPDWKVTMIEANEGRNEAITKYYEEPENIYDDIESCQDDNNKTTEGLDTGDVQIIYDYELKAIRNIKDVKAYTKKKTKKQPKDVAYVLIQKVTLLYSTDDTPDGRCVKTHYDHRYIYTKKAKKMTYLGEISGSEFLPVKKK